MGTRAKIVVALLLTFCAGVVDIVGFLSLYNTFTAHMTGVTVHMGQYAGARDLHHLAALAAVLGTFFLGSVIGRSLVEVMLSYHVRSAAAPTLAMEATLVLVVAISGQNTKHVLIMSLLLAGAMGLQTAALTRVGPLTVHTTFVTGMLNKLAQLVTHLFFGHNDRSIVMRHASLLLGVWLIYFFGASCGAWLKTIWDVRTLLIPAVLIAATSVVDLVNPLSIQEERDQSER